ncbi:MAG: hypothetical protein IPJ65_08580 [Archangiaceae bacterium]|nr:hypothetical protein [Archangiaceae bacterium]
MFRCTRCDGFVPRQSTACPNCRAAAKKAWWSAPLAFAGAGLATVTLSACYGAPCVITVNLPDGGTKKDTTAFDCYSTYDCNQSADGGVPEHDTEWENYCK